MFYLILTEENYNKVNSYLYRYENQKINSPFFKEGYCLMGTEAVGGEILDIVKKEKIETVFLNPFISVKTFLDLYKNIELSNDVCTPESYDYSIFENIIAYESGIKPSHNGAYVLMNRFDDDENDGVQKVQYLNSELTKAGLLLPEFKYKKGLKEIFKNAIDEADNELFSDDEDKELIKLKQKNYGLFVVALFLLDAYNYYSKEEIITFMIRNFDLFRPQK